MLYYAIHLDGEDSDIEAMVGVLAEYDEYIDEDEIEKDYDFMEEGNEELELDDLEQMVVDMANVAPCASFSIKGEDVNHGCSMAFEFVFDNKKLISKCSEWYISYVCNSFNYENYEEFCENTGLADRVSEEQYDAYMEQETEIIVLDSGDGEVVAKDKIPMDSTEIDWNNDDADDE